MRRTYCYALLCLLASGMPGALASSEVPVAVSPGGTEELLRIEGRCPTFSWSPAEGAGGYELVVYDLDEVTESPTVDSHPGASPVLTIRLPGPALAWTPSAADCLEWGRAYLWFVRESGESQAEWSTARFFEVPGEPTLSEVEDALETLRRFVEGRERGRDETRTALFDLLERLRRSRPLGPRQAAPHSAGSTPPLASALAGFKVGLGAELPDTTTGTVALSGVSNSTVDGSAGVFGEALAAVGVTDGVRGDSLSVNGAGVRGNAWSPTGPAAGVTGLSISPQGYGGFFFNLLPGAAAVFANNFGGGFSPDLVLGGNDASDDEGTIYSDPSFPSSDLLLFSNDALRVVLDNDNDGEDADFHIVDGSGTTIFNVDESGDTSVGGGLVVGGGLNAEGGLSVVGDVSVNGDALAALIAQTVDDAILQHRIAEHANVVFVTREQYDGAFSLLGPDRACLEAAIAAGLDGSFKAWTSGNQADDEPRDRMTQDTVPYVRVDGVRVADNWADLTDGSLAAPINIDQFAEYVSTNPYAWTNTLEDGSRRFTDQSCNNGPVPWYTNSSAVLGSTAYIHSSSSNWTGHVSASCDQQRRLYCFQQ